MSEASPRHRLFQPAWTRADWSPQQLWVSYLALGGTGDVFDIEAFLHGLAPLSHAQQDVLATAVNERLDDLYLAHRVPYSVAVQLPPCRCQDPLAVLDELLAADPPNESARRVNAMTTPESSPEDPATGNSFAAPAAMTVQSADVPAQTRRLAAQLRAALETRSTIDRAIGILFNRSSGTETEALNRLRTAGPHEQHRVAEVAQQIVDDAVRRAETHRNLQ